MYCKQGIIGAQFSHPQRGHALCCATDERYHGSPNDVWFNKLAPARDKLLRNEKIQACASCYLQEEQKVTSFRQIYNKQFENLDTKNLPQHLDLDLSNFCNLKCIMCDPSRSSTWAKEAGQFKDTNGITKVSDNDLDQICELSHNLKHLTLQGGEPSIIPQYEVYFDYLKEHNIIQNVHLNVVTNLTNLKQKFYSYMPHFASVSISVSVDAFADANNFIRYPSKFDHITNNIKDLTKHGNNLNVKIDTAVQVLSMFNINDFANWFVDLEQHFTANKKYIGQYIQHVHTPEELCIMNAPRSLKESFLTQIEGTGFKHLEQSINMDHSYDHSKTVKYIKDICKIRNLDINSFVPDFKLHYEII